MHSRLAVLWLLLLLLLLPACGSSSAPTTPVNPAASPASIAPSPMSTSTSMDDPPCQTPPPGDALDTGSIELSDPHFPLAWYRECHELNDDYPWQPVNNVPFLPGRTYTQAEQDQVTQSERRIFNATEKWVTEFGVRKKELDITHRDNPQASSPQPVSEFAASALSTPPEATSQTMTGPINLRNRFGNNLFGSGYTGSTFFGYERRANDAIVRIWSNATVTTNLLNTSRDLVSFFVNSECLCDLRSLTAPPRSRSVNGEYYLMGQRTQPVGTWPNGFAPPRQNRRVFERRGHRFFSARMRFMVGPVPMMLEASVTGSAALDVVVTPECPRVTLDITPTADLSVSASWSVNVRIIRAGIQANLSLLNLTMPMQASVGISGVNNPNFCADWSANLNRTARTLNGDVELFTTVRFLFFQERFAVTIARWRGITLSDVTQARTGNLCLPNAFVQPEGAPAN